jgi:hypothetical protein
MQEHVMKYKYPSGDRILVSTKTEANCSIEAREEWAFL